MKKITAISLLILFLGANTELHQLLRLPVLIRHYIEHCADDPEHSWVQFFTAHYAAAFDHADNNHHDHDKLPFKTAHCGMFHFTPALVNHFEFTSHRPFICNRKTTSVSKREFYSSSVIRNIWQPPKYS